MIRLLRSLFFIFGLSLVVAGVCGCQRGSEMLKPIESQSADKISVGVVLPLTGHLAATGKRMKQGFDLAGDTYENLSLIFLDSTGTRDGAISAFNQLIHQDDVSVILGPATSTATEAAFPIAEENQIVAISPTAGARGLTEIGDYVFRIPLATDVVLQRGIALTQAKLGYQRVATLYDATDLFSTDHDTVLREIFTAKEIEVLTMQTFHSGDIDFSAQLRRIKALNPDAIFISALPPEKPNILLEAAQLGITAPIVIASLTRTEIETAGVAAEGAITFTAWLASHETPGNQAFVEDYTTTFGTPPDAFAAVSYATVSILAAAIKNAESIDATGIQNALANLKDLPTILGSFSFDADRNAVYDPKVMVVKDGALQPFE